VNVLQGHPFDPILATVGIDYSVKIFQPVRVEMNPMLNEENVRRDNQERVTFL
jgi:hypothetical protein